MGDGFCESVPAAVSSFVDTFIDFVVSGGEFVSDRRSEAEKNTANYHHQRHRQEKQKKKQDHHQHHPQQQQQQQDQKQQNENQPLFKRIPAAERLVAVGDIHGDLSKAKESLRLAGVLGDDEHWSGGKTVVVQVGDLLDRGSEELKVVYFMERLKREAQRQGGELYIMNGNHETMNVEGDYRYVTPEGFTEFQTWGEWFRRGQALKQRCQGLESQPDLFKGVRKDIPEGVRSRFVALKPGGPISSRFFADHPTILMVGSTLFAHAGILPVHAEYGLEKINSEIREWILGRNGLRGPDWIRGKDSLLWQRYYSMPIEALCDCKLLEEALRGVPGADRMVVGHTVQGPFGINSACNNKVFRVDVGMSKGCGNFAPEVLEILRDGEVRVLSKQPPKGNLKGNLKEKITSVPPGLASILA